MTKLKKTVLTACFAGTVMLAGAGLGLLSEQYTVYADESGEQNNVWVTVPRINGWEYGSFQVSRNLFVAEPAYGGGEGDPMKFTFSDATGKTLSTLYAYANSDGTLTYGETNVINAPMDMEMFAMGNFNIWTPGNYKMTVTVNGVLSSYTGLEAEVPFTISKAKNFWTESPNIMSWYEGEFDEHKNYPEPAAKAAYGTAVFTVYGLEETPDGEYVTEDGEYVIDSEAVYSVSELGSLKAGTYALVASVEGTDNYEGLETTVYFRVFTSDATLAALTEAKESARDELEAFARELGVNLSDLDSGVMAGIDTASTIKNVKFALESAKVRVYQIYAIKSIADYAVELGVESGYNYEEAVADEKKVIEQAGDLITVKTALASARDKIYSLGVQRKKSEAQSAAQQDAAYYGVAYNAQMQGLIGSAQTLEEVTEALNEIKKNIIETAFEKATDLATYKIYVKEAIVRYAVYVGVEATEMGADIIVRYQSYAESAASRSAVTAVYEGEEGAKAAINGIRSNEQTQLLSSLSDIVERYKTRYPAATDKLDEIMARVSNNQIISSQLTVPRSRREYQKVLAEIRECVLEDAIVAAIAELDKAIEEAKLFGYDRDMVVAALENAADIDEVEAVLHAAMSEIGSTLYALRMEKIEELEVFAEKYYTDYNWRALMNAYSDGKDGINRAQSYSAILDAFEDAKLGFVYAYVLAELDHYGAVYESYNVANAVAVGKSALLAANSEEEYLNILKDAEEGICGAAKEKAVADLTVYNDYYRAWDRTEAVNAITSAETVSRVDELYTQAYATLMLLVSQRDAAITSAREMLTVYAQNLGVEDLNAVKEAILGIGAAQTPEEVPHLFDTAKETIDRAADAEQQRITASNKAAIAFACIFGFATAGLGIALGLILYQRRAGKKKGKGGTQPPQGHPQQPGKEQPAQVQPQQVPPQYYQPQQTEQPQPQPVQPQSVQPRQEPHVPEN